MEPLTVVFICAGLIGLYALRTRVGIPSSHSILPFQGGILYRRGRPAREVGPGKHRVFVGREKIIFLDRRPMQVNVERRAVSLADGATAVYGFAASAEVRDVRKALYSSANYTQIPGFVTLCVTRGVLNRSQSSQIRYGQPALTEEIVDACRSRLAEAGFELLSFRFSQLVVATPPPGK